MCETSTQTAEVGTIFVLSLKNLLNGMHTTCSVNLFFEKARDDTDCFVLLLARHIKAFEMDSIFLKIR